MGWTMPSNRILLLAILLLGTAWVAVRQCDCPGPYEFHLRGTWVPIGPVEITQSIYAAPNSGRATVIATNPYNSDDVWLGTATGGVWHSTNINSVDYEWTCETDSVQSLSVGAILLEDCSAQGCETVWIGTGENNLRRDTYYGCGLLKLTWSATSGSYEVSAVGDTDYRFRGGAIIDIKRVGSSLYVAVSKGKSCSASTAIVTAPEPPDGYGIHRSNDEGLTWQHVGTSPYGALPSDMEVQNGSLLVGFRGAGIYRLGIGDVWCPLGPSTSSSPTCPSGSSLLPDPDVDTFDHVEIEVSPKNADILFAAYGQCESETFLCGQNPLFFYSDDGGSTWQSRTNGAVLRSYSQYTHVLEADPLSENKVYYGGFWLWFSSSYGENFGVVSDAQDLHPDMQDLAFPDPTASLIQFAATDGGFYKRGWLSGARDTRARNHGLETIQTYSLSCSDWDGAQLVLAGTQDNGTVLFNGGPVWEFVLAADGGDCIIARDDLFYASEWGLAPYRAATVNPHYGSFTRIDENLEGPNLFTPPFVIHKPTFDLYFGTNRLYKRTAADLQWNPVSPEFDTSSLEYPDIERRNAISALAISDSDPNTIYVALYNGDIWVSNESGPCTAPNCWAQVGGAAIENELPESVPTSLEVDPEDPQRVYVTYSDFTAGPKVWVSRDRGESWEDFSQGLPEGLPVKVIRLKPDERHVMFLGTDNGVYRRDTKGWFRSHYDRLLTEWLFYGPEFGIPHVPVYDIDFDTTNNLVYAATHGRGVYMLAKEPVITVVVYFSGTTLRGLYLFGHAFNRITKDVPVIHYLDGKGKVIGETRSDGRGGELAVDTKGRLVSRNKGTYGNSVQIYPCLSESCQLGQPPSKQVALSDVAGVEVQYGDQSARADLKDRPTIREDPPSTVLLVRKLAPRASGRITLAATFVGEEVEEPLGEWTEASVDVEAGDESRDIARKLVGAFNEKSRATGYRATILADGRKESEGEDVSPPRPLIMLHNERLDAMQIFTVVEADPGAATGLAFDIEGIGLFAKGEMVQMSVEFSTGGRGARGGKITLAQRTPSGVCRATLETREGETSEEITRELYDTIMDMRYPGTLDCEARCNSYDLGIEDDRLITSSARGLSIGIEDSGVGVRISPR